MALTNDPQMLLNKQRELLQRVVFLLNKIFLSNDTLKKDKGIIEMKNYLLIPSSLSSSSKLEKFKDIAARNLASSPLQAAMLFSVQDKQAIQNFYSALRVLDCTSIEGINSSIANLNMRFPQKEAPNVPQNARLSNQS